MLFDTHLHLIDREKLRYPWLRDVPRLARDWDLASYETVARRVGIVGALHMEVDVHPDDIVAETDFIRGLARQPRSLLRGAISAARPEHDGFASFLETVDQDFVKGFRRVLHVANDGISKGALFRENVGLLGKAGFVFDICVNERQLPEATALIDACPNTVFVLDHFGNPDLAGGDIKNWATQIRDLARRDNVHGKISGITANAPGNWTMESLRPYVEIMVDSFGWDRIVWGSDSPVVTLNSNLAEWVALTHGLFADVSNDERDKLYHTNAQRIWNVQT